jgi:hypothetical protein
MAHLAAHMQQVLSTIIMMDRPELAVSYFSRSLRDMTWISAISQSHADVGARATARMISAHPLFMLAQSVLSQLSHAYPAVAKEFYALCARHGLFTPYIQSTPVEQRFVAAEEALPEHLAGVIDKHLYSHPRVQRRLQQQETRGNNRQSGSWQSRADEAASAARITAEAVHLRVLAQSITGVPLFIVKPAVRNGQKPFTHGAAKHLAPADVPDERLATLLDEMKLSELVPYLSFTPAADEVDDLIHGVPGPQHLLGDGVYAVPFPNLTKEAVRRLGWFWTTAIFSNIDSTTPSPSSALPRIALPQWVLHPKEKQYTVNIPLTAPPGAVEPTPLIGDADVPAVHIGTSGEFGTPKFDLVGPVPRKLSAPAPLSLTHLYIPPHYVQRPFDAAGYWGTTALFAAQYMLDRGADRFVRIPDALTTALRGVDAELALHRLAGGCGDAYLDNTIVDADTITSLSSVALNAHAALGLSTPNLLREIDRFMSTWMQTHGMHHESTIPYDFEEESDEQSVTPAPEASTESSGAPDAPLDLNVAPEAGNLNRLSMFFDQVQVVTNTKDAKQKEAFAQQREKEKAQLKETLVGKNPRGAGMATVKTKQPAQAEDEVPVPSERGGLFKHKMKQ